MADIQRTVYLALIAFVQLLVLHIKTENQLLLCFFTCFFLNQTKDLTTKPQTILASAEPQKILKSVSPDREHLFLYV